MNFASFVAFIFGKSWKSSLAGFGAAAAISLVAYAQARSEPGWYVVALAIGALGRFASDEQKKLEGEGK